MGVGSDERTDRFSLRCNPMLSVIGSLRGPEHMDTSVLAIHDPVFDDTDFCVQMSLDLEILFQGAIGDLDRELHVYRLGMAIPVTSTSYPETIGDHDLHTANGCQLAR